MEDEQMTELADAARRTGGVAWSTDENGKLTYSDGQVSEADDSQMPTVLKKWLASLGADDAKEVRLYLEKTHSGATDTIDVPPLPGPAQSTRIYDHNPFDDEDDEKYDENDIRHMFPDKETYQNWVDSSD